jgi:hypothetical protein
MAGDVKIASFGTNHEAELARLYLDENGFDVRLEDDVLIGTALPLEAALGGVKMFAPEDQAEEAARLLEEFRSENSRTIEPESREKTISRAFRMAVIGFVICPGVMHLWSFATALNVSPEGLRPASVRTRRLTVVLSTLGVALTTAAVFVALMTPPDPPPPPPPQPVFVGPGMLE